MDRTLASIRNSQKYSAVQDEDFEETVSEESGIRRATVVHAAHEPCRSSWYSVAKFLFSREILAIHLAWLLLLVLSIFCLQFLTSYRNCPVSGLPSDVVFGEIPFRVVSWEEDKAFVNSDPMDGRRWNRSREFGVDWTPWDDIHPGQSSRPEPCDSHRFELDYIRSWVRMTPSSELGISGGIPLREYSRDGSWNTDDQGFALSMHHQIHCLGLMKHVFVKAERNQTVSPKDFRHMDHCIEYIRQAILCHGDLTLEPLMPGSTQTAIESVTWGSKHYCRDWNVLKEVLSKTTTIGFDKQGYVFDRELV